MKHKIALNQIKTFLILLLTVISQGLSAQNENKYCCSRTLVFTPFPMPEGQELDISGFIINAWDMFIFNKIGDDMGECPHPLGTRDWTGSLNLDDLLSRIKAAMNKSQPEFNSPNDLIKEFEYIWIGNLELVNIDTIIAGSWKKDAKTGSRQREPGEAYGSWKFSVSLFNPQWNEVVKEASSQVWKRQGENIKELEAVFNEHFANLKEIIWDYEQVPVKTELIPDKESVESGEKMDIRLKLFDDKDQPPKHWQRIMVEVSHGKLENGVRCKYEDSKNHYAFFCDNGNFDLKYVAPNKMNISEDTILVYNTCQTKHTSIVPLDGEDYDEQDKIGEIPIKINLAITIHVRETESGFVRGGDPPYPYNFTVSMSFKGRAINSKSFYQIIPNLPESLRSKVMKEGSMNFKEECILIAELEPDEKSMKVERWECSDPVNNTAPPPLLAASPPNFFVPTRIWQIGEKIYISHGFLDGVNSYFPFWDDPRSLNKEQPLGARCDGTFGKMGEYVEIPYKKFINGETVVLHPKDVSDHNDDVWQWQTNWTVTLNPQ
jgi:hypothetical protein